MIAILSGSRFLFKEKVQAMRQRQKYLDLILLLFFLRMVEMVNENTF